MKRLQKPAVFLVIFIFTILFITGCSQAENVIVKEDFIIPVPTAPGTIVESDGDAFIDYSNLKDGYVIAGFDGSSESTLRVIVTAPHGETYIYALNDGGAREVIPLTEGNGEYRIGIYEHVSEESYNKLVAISVDVELINEFSPFIQPNQFVNYSKDSDLVGLASELTKDAATVKDKIITIYDYVIDNFTYDYDLAGSVESGYLPDLDYVLEKKEGICFDYSALVTAMLRSQGIPARLEIGYHGEQYHAWISLFCEDNGWIENRYHYDYEVESWSVMDPTLESDEHRTHKSRQQARDDENYRLLFNY